MLGSVRLNAADVKAVLSVSMPAVVKESSRLKAPNVTAVLSASMPLVVVESVKSAAFAIKHVKITHHNMYIFTHCICPQLFLHWINSREQIEAFIKMFLRELKYCSVNLNYSTV